MEYVIFAVGLILGLVLGLIICKLKKKPIVTTPSNGVLELLFKQDDSLVAGVKFSTPTEQLIELSSVKLDVITSQNLHAL